LPVRSSFDRRNYDSVSELVPAEFIVGNLKQRYGPELNDPKYYPDESFSMARKVAHQFVYLHNSVTRHAAIEEADQPDLNREDH
jgi:hypothetical protein